MKGLLREEFEYTADILLQTVLSQIKWLWLKCYRQYTPHEGSNTDDSRYN